MDETQEVPRGPVIATYTVKITVRGPVGGVRTEGEEETPTNEAIEEGVSLALMRYMPEGATATVVSERSDR